MHLETGNRKDGRENEFTFLMFWLMYTVRGF